MCFRWGNFHFFNRKWCMGFRQYCCFAFNNLQAEQRERNGICKAPHRQILTLVHVELFLLSGRDRKLQGKQTNKSKQTNKPKIKPKAQCKPIFSTTGLTSDFVHDDPHCPFSVSNFFGRSFVGLLVCICVFLEMAHWMMPCIRLWPSLHCLELPVSGTDRIAKNRIQSLMQE